MQPTCTSSRIQYTAGVKRDRTFALADICPGHMPPDLYDRGRLHAPSRLGLELRVKVRVVVGIWGYGYGSGQFRINVSSDRQTFAMVVCGERTGFRGAKVVHMVTKRSASEIWRVSHRSIILSSGTAHVGQYMSKIKSTIPSDCQRACEIYTAVMYSDRLNNAAVKYARLVNEGRDEVRTLHWILCDSESSVH